MMTSGADKKDCKATETKTTGDYMMAKTTSKVSMKFIKKNTQSKSNVILAEANANNLLIKNIEILRFL